MNSSFLLRCTVWANFSNRTLQWSSGEVVSILASQSEGHGFNFSASGLSMWSLHVLPVSDWVLSRFSSFLLRSCDKLATSKASVLLSSLRRKELNLMEWKPDYCVFILKVACQKTLDGSAMHHCDSSAPPSTHPIMWVTSATVWPSELMHGGSGEFAVPGKCSKVEHAGLIVCKTWNLSEDIFIMGQIKNMWN